MKLLTENEISSLHAAHGFAKVEEALLHRLTIFEQSMCKLPVTDALPIQYSELKAKIAELQNIMQMFDITR